MAENEILPRDISFELARPVEDDARLVMDWRNDPETLRMFFHPEPKVPEKFFPEFFADYFRRPDLPPLFALFEGQRVAFLRFLPFAETPEPLRASCDVSLNVKPDLRGKGFGAAILTAVQPFLRGRGFEDVFAEIRKENAASQKVFAKAGFQSLGDRQKVIEDTGEQGDIVLLRARLSPAPFSEKGVFIIAEAGSNWRMGTPERDLEMAKALIEVAAEAGADAVKFQTYRPETVYAEKAGQSDYLAEAGIKRDISEIFADLAMPYEMIPELKVACDEKGIGFMSTPFSPADFDAVDPHVLVHKIASYEISHPRLLEKAAQSGKPLVLSTGASREEDIEWAVSFFRESGGESLCLLQCTAKYPAPPESLNLRVIPWLARRFGVAAGLSDHSRDPLHAPLCAVALGARVIEKHFTLDNQLPGPDHSFAVTPPELSRMVAAIRDAEKILGTGIKEVHPEEKELFDFARRGLMTTRDVARGEVLAEGVNIGILRPGKQKPGLHPKRLPDIEGKKATRDIPSGEGIHEDDWTDD